MASKSSANGVLTFVGVIMLIIGTVFFIVGTCILVSDIKFMQNAEQTDAVISDIITYRDSDGDHRHTVFVTYTVDDVEYESSINEYSTSMKIGKHITVYYDTDNPRDVNTGSKLLPILFMSLGGIFIIVSGGMLGSVLKKNSRRKRLLTEGERLTGTIKHVTVNTSIRVNGKNPYKADVEVIDSFSGETYLYSTGNVYLDLWQYEGQQVDVYVDRQDKSRYYVDVDGMTERYMSENNVHDYR